MCRQAPLCVVEFVCEMACYHPLYGYKSATKNANGKRSIVFNRNAGFVDLPVTLPCGQCIGCRLERSRQWAIRCVHEAQLHTDNCFLTLTYNDGSLPSGNTLVKKHFQDFMKRLRFKYKSNNIRYFHCGEYGETYKRPHYHAIIFGLDFQDKEIFSQQNGVNLYTSPSLQKLWPFGFSTIGNVTFESAAYVARYVMKKINGDLAAKHYESIIPETGEIIDRLPEYITMSLKPAVGKGWFEKFHSDVFPSDEIILRGKKLKPPKYYDKLYDIVQPQNMIKIKGNRIKEGKKHKDDQTPERLAVKKICKQAQINSLIRTLE